MWHGHWGGQATKLMLRDEIVAAATKARTHTPYPRRHPRCLRGAWLVA
jgi:hypothetical protein